MVRHLFSLMLLLVWIAAYPAVVGWSQGAEPDVLASIQGRLFHSLSHREDILPRVAAGIKVLGTCDRSRCQLETGREALGLPPLYVSGLTCRLTLMFEKIKLSDLSLKVEGLGRTCSKAERDAELQAISALEPLVEDVALAMSRKMTLRDLKEVLLALDQSVLALEAGSSSLEEQADYLLQQARKAMKALEEEQ